MHPIKFFPVAVRKTELASLAFLNQILKDTEKGISILFQFELFVSFCLFCLVCIVCNIVLFCLLFFCPSTLDLQGNGIPFMHDILHLRQNLQVCLLVMKVLKSHIFKADISVTLLGN